VQADYETPGPDAPRLSTDVAGLAPYMFDPFEYPPVFAVAPRLALAATDDYHLLRAVWFGVSALGFWIAFVGLAVWIGGRAGGTALLLAPPIALSTPFLLGLQFGQAHLLVVAAAIAGMMQLARGRRWTGASLLAFATATKLFPGLLLVHLAVRRRWRDVAATLVALAALVGIAALVLGPATLSAYVTEQLPRMASGEAFGFTEHNPDNHSLYGLAFKLGALGVAGADRHLASLLGWAWTAVAVALAVTASRGRAEPGRDAVVWLGILCLATLRAPFAPTYTAIGTLWLLSAVVGQLGPRRWRTVLIVVAWILLQGAPPLGSDAINAAATLPGQAASIAIAVLAVWPRRAAASALVAPSGT
jgi:hypothetical protein